MLDTNILIYTIKSRPEEVRHQFEAHDGEMCVSSITAMELLYGAHKSQAVRRNLDVVEGLLARLEILDFDLAAAEHAGQIRAELTSLGRQISPFDLLISGHARSRGLCLVTNNVSEFQRVVGLRLTNWAN